MFRKYSFILWLRRLFLLAPLAILLTTSGCIRPWNTELPTVYSGHPEYERQRNERFDPFASTDLGPQTFTRPRDFDNPRDPARRARDADAYQAPVVPGTVHPQFAPQPSYPQQRYPNVVPN